MPFWRRFRREPKWYDDPVLWDVATDVLNGLSAAIQRDAERTKEGIKEDEKKWKEEKRRMDTKDGRRVEGGRSEGRRGAGGAEDGNERREESRGRKR